MFELERALASGVMTSGETGLPACPPVPRKMGVMRLDMDCLALRNFFFLLPLALATFAFGGLPLLLLFLLFDLCCSFV